MIIIRFYANDDGIELLSKYAGEADRGLPVIKELCAPVLAGLEGVPDPYDILNKRLAELESRLLDAGFERVPTVDADDTDSRCNHAFDILIDPKNLAMTFIVFDIEPTGDASSPYAKKLKEKIVVGGVKN